MVGRPGMVRANCSAGAGWRKSSAEVRQCKRRDLILDAQLDGGVIEGAHRRVELGQKRRLRVDLTLMRVESADRREKDLAVHIDLCAGQIELDDLGDLLQLIADSGSRKDGVQSGIHA